MNSCLFCSLKSGKVLYVSFSKTLAKAECGRKNLICSSVLQRNPLRTKWNSRY